ncbi:MAG: hypothetical protein J4478_01850 [Candidatus Diapherotrites archaeon]|uniref:Uncharacterized protein n=1 Tax=Candidatus Iainarchaeum sp. TaxID=3101447 RepID=A0A8T4KX07_9ARCH|nr:hypothetical protein [Candidatus Diapherotrites archaeon]
MCKVLVGKIVAIDGEFAIVDFRIAQKKAINKIANARLNDFVMVKGNLILEVLEKRQGKEMIEAQLQLARTEKKAKKKA